MLRDTTVLPGGDVGNSNQDSDVWWNVRSTIYSANPYTQVYLDTVPGTWSSGAITYKAQGLTTSSSYSFSINRDNNNAATQHDSPGASSLTLMEIAA